MSLENRKEELRKEIERKARYLASLDAMPDFEELVDGTVVGLLVTLGRSRPYAYIAYKAAGSWFLTGSNSPNKVSSDDLAEWLVTGGRRLAFAGVLAEFRAPDEAQAFDLGSALADLLSSIR